MTPAESLHEALRRALPPEIAEVLLPSMRLRLGSRRVIVALHNRIWLDVFRAHVQDIAQAEATRLGLALSVAVHDETVETATRTFATFVEDPGNRLALAACRRVVQAPGVEHNPLYVHGPAGSGKTHLAESIAAELRQSAGDGAVVFVRGDEFVARWAQALSAGGRHPFRAALDEAVVVICDGVDALAERSLAQEAFFSLLNDCLEQGRQVVVTGAAPPHRLVGFEERVTTRLGWGLPVAVEIPLLETRLAALHALCPAAAEMDADELAQWVEHTAGDMHQLVRLAERIALGERPGEEQAGTAFDRILSVVAEAYAVRPADIAGKGRARQVSRARQAALLLGRRLTDYSLQALGGMVGGRDHATVLYLVREAEERSAADADFAREIADLGRRVRG
jgi:chromosomal replication initiator protein